MARKPRVEYPGALYHIMCRGNNGEYVLKEDEDKTIYLDLIKKYKQKYNFKIFSYCIMDNHVHMLIEMDSIPISKIMQGIQQSFTQRYNKKYGRTGHVFQQRYKAQICDKDRYLLQLVKYIHNNPVEAGLKEGLNYSWSSHKKYLKGKNDELLEVNLVLGMLCDNNKKAQKLYRDMMRLDTGQKDVRIFSLPHENSDKISGNTFTELEEGVDKIIDTVCREAGVQREEIIRRTKIQRYSDIRKVIVLLSEKYTYVTNTKLAKILNIPLSMVTKIRSGESRGTKMVENLIRSIENKGIIQA